MAVATKTLTPTNQVVNLPDMTEPPDNSVNVDDISKLVDAVNELNSKIIFVEKSETITIGANATKNQRIDYGTLIPSGYTVICVTPSVSSGDVIDVSVNAYNQYYAYVRITSYHSAELERDLALRIICMKE